MYLITNKRGGRSLLSEIMSVLLNVNKKEKEKVETRLKSVNTNLPIGSLTTMTMLPNAGSESSSPIEVSRTSGSTLQLP